MSEPRQPEVSVGMRAWRRSRRKHVLTAILALLLATAASGPASGSRLAQAQAVISTAQMVSGTTGLNGIACPSSTCYAVGQNGDSGGVVVTLPADGSASVQPVPGTTDLVGIACTSSACEAVGINGLDPRIQAAVTVSIPTGGLPSVQTVAGARELNGITCPTDTCYAVGAAGTDSNTCYAVTATDRLPLTGVVVTIPADGAPSVETVAGASSLNGITCPTSTCYAVGASGESPTAVGVVVTVQTSGAG